MSELQFVVMKSGEDPGGKMWSQNNNGRSISVRKQLAVGSCMSGSTLVGSVSFSHQKNYAGGVPEERFTEKLGMDLKRLRSMNA